MKQSARKRHKYKNINISKKRHIKKRYTRKLYKTKASGLHEDNERLSEYKRLLQKYKIGLAKWQASVANQSLSPDMRALADEAVIRYQRAVRIYTEAVQMFTTQAATKIQAATRGKTARSRVASIKIEAAADAKELAEALAAIGAMEAAVAAKKTAPVKSLPPYSPKNVSEIGSTFSYIKGLLSTNTIKNIEAGNRYDPFGKSVLFYTFKKYIEVNGGIYKDIFIDELALDIKEEFKTTMLGKDVSTYIEFNINILCPETQLHIQITGATPFWKAHISMVDDSTLIKSKRGNPKFLSHITFIKCITPCNTESTKLTTLHVYRTTEIGKKGDPLPSELKNLPSEIDRKRLQIFKDLVFNFLDNHQTQLTEASDQEEYEKAQQSEKKIFDIEHRVRHVRPVTSRGKSWTRSVSEKSVLAKAKGRKFTLKTSSHKTRYNKRKRKTIKSTHKNKRRK